MSAPDELERAAIERDRDLAWELYDFQPEHPRIPELALSVLARAPQFTGMIILLALHRHARGDDDEARRLLQELIGRRDRQFLNAVRKLRDLESSAGNFVESLRLAELVLREDPEASWEDRMDHANALAHTDDPETAWRRIDQAVELSARTDPEQYAQALGQRALRFLATGAPPDRFLRAAQQAIEADPTEPLLATALAYAYLYDYRVDEAKQLLLGVLREDPTDTVAQTGMTIVNGILGPIERGVATMDQIRAGGLGEIVWRTLRDQLFGTGTAEALDALDEVLPADLRQALHPPLDAEAARASGGDHTLLGRCDGQDVGTGLLWGTGEPFRLLTGSEVRTTDDAIEQHPADWPQWDHENEYFTLLFTDDNGSYLFEGSGGRLFRRSPGQSDQQVASSLADWLWDRVAAFGGTDARPGWS